MKKTIISLTICGFLLFLLCLPMPRVAAAEKLEVINVGYIPIGDCLQLSVADGMGFFKGEGIAVEKNP